MSTIFSKVIFSLFGLILISAIGVWLFWEESTSWFKQPFREYREPGILFAAIYSS
ncbi:MAG: hypothetical protein AAGD96_32715 [Chloroflexota bacterium]